MIGIQGEVQVTDDLTIEGSVDGTIYCESSAVTISPTATVSGDIYARDITVLGSFHGSLVATEVVDLREGAAVGGRILCERVILNEGATFNGKVEPQHLDAALKVARHRRGAPAPALSRSGHLSSAASAPPRIVQGPVSGHLHAR